jgi:NADPH-dependent glutamate synthase beta subunit-like oxidoreductase
LAERTERRLALFGVDLNRREERLVHPAFPLLREPRLRVLAALKESQGGGEGRHRVFLDFGDVRQRRLGRV